MNNDILNLGKSLKGIIGKRVTPLMLAGTLIFSSGVVSANALSFDEPQVSYEEFLKYDGIKVFVNGRYVEFNNKTGYPMQVNGMTFVPVEVVAKAFNAHYATEGKSAFVSKYGSELKIRTEPQHFQFINDLSNPGDLLAIIWGREQVNFIPMDGRAFYKDSKVYMSISTLFEMFGAKVVWNESKTVINVISDYDKNSKFIDFKNQKVIEMKDVDVNKEYTTIEFDGVIVSADYLKLLKNSNQYKVMVDGNNLYIYSYQYLMDINYLYDAHQKVKYDLSDEKNSYELWSISEREIDFVDSLAFDDGYRFYVTGDTIDMDEVGNLYRFNSYAEGERFRQALKVAEEIAELARRSTTDQKEMIRIANNELCNLMTYKETINETYFINSSIYEALVGKKDYCMGYAFAFKAVMDKLGIPCVVIRGSSTKGGLPHAWNEVYVENEWKAVDVSLNDKASKRDAMLLKDVADIDNYVPDYRRADYDSMQRVLRLTPLND